MKFLIKMIVLLAICGAIAVAIAMNANRKANGKAGAQAKSSAATANQPTTATATASGSVGIQKSKPRVKVAVLKPGPITEILSLPGNVEAWQDIDLSCRIGGTIEWVGPKEGDRVTSGQEIIRLDRESLKAQVAQVRAQAEQAERQYARMENLHGSGVIQRAELDKYFETREMTRAMLKVATVALDNGSLRAPISGVIDRIHVDPGEHVDTGRAIAKIVQIDRLKVVVELPEKDVQYIREGMPAAVVPAETGGALGAAGLTVPGIGTLLRGRVYYVALTADPNGRTYPTYIELDNAKRALRPGMIVQVHLVRRHVADALSVPLFAAVDRGDRKVVFVATDARKDEKSGEMRARAEQRSVVPGIMEMSRIQIVQGLSAGERLIVVGQQNLVDGAEIIIDGEADVETPSLLPAGLSISALAGEVGK
jgi:membrane fusion protein (multidrug efflux system)